jgi:hypothetical protein
MVGPGIPANPDDLGCPKFGRNLKGIFIKYVAEWQVALASKAR